MRSNRRGQFLLPLERVATPPTVDVRKFRPPLDLRVGAAQTEIRVAGRQPVRVSGNSALILRVTTELTWGQGPVHWRSVADRIWRVNATQANWYTSLDRLRRRLRALSVYEHLVRSDGGQVRLDAREGVDRVQLLSGPAS